MNKFLLFALITLAVGQMVTADPIEELFAEDGASQFALITASDSAETASLDGRMTIFSDFCISSRDYIVGDIKTSVKDMAANFFSMFFKSAEKIQLAFLRSQQTAIDNLGNQIRDSDASFPDIKDAISRALTDNQQETDGAEPKTIFQAFVSALSATKDAITSSLAARLRDIKEQIGLLATVNALNGLCGKASEYEEEIKARFNAVRDELAAHDPTLAEIKLENVKCLTNSRVSRIVGLCKFSEVAQSPLLKILTYRPEA